MEREVSLLQPPPQESIEPSPVRDLLPPANPIITKAVYQQQRAPLRIDLLAPLNPQQQATKRTRRPSSEQKDSQDPSSAQGERRKKGPSWKPYMEVMTLTNGYQPDTLIFKRYLNDSLNRRGKRQFFSSLFLGIQGNRGQRLPQYKGMLRDDDLIFDSNFQSGNLMAVFKIQDRVYDLVLQNDVNTRGFTQWYNFKVSNRRNNFIAKFNIVNLYKSKSLYSIGMKPIVRSEKSDRNVKKTWRRKGFNIYYDKNALSYEDNEKKCYKTLSFEYDFTVEDDTVQFAHGMPYDLSDLQRLLSHIKQNAKVKISTIGNTLMGKPIPLIKISAVQEAGRVDKKALVILARQHPGQTPGSFIAEQMILELLRNSSESDFLAWRFDIFIFPMVNQDGVQLGNYRSNFAGFDLNRCWLRPDSVKHPEVIAIKNYIKKLQKKYKIELVLDLHGHSRNMGSFFYGNNFGTNFMLFPYIASKGNRNILFEKSRFSHQTETDAKGSTARVVLGNMLRQSGGYVYTYQVSFYGNYKEDHTPFAFQEDHYKQLAHTLVQSVYKTYLQLYKEEKTLKESHFLKTTKTELHDIAISRKIEDQEASGSDSQAEEEMEQEVEQIQQFFQQAKYMEEFSPPPIEIVKRPSAYQGIDREISISQRVKQLRDLGEPQEHSQQVKHKIQQLLEKNLNEDLREVILQRLPSIRRENQRQNTFSELKREIAASSGFRVGQETSGRQLMSVETSKGKLYGLPEHFRVKKYKNYFDWLKVSGETFTLQERERRQMAQEQHQQKNFAQERSKKTVQHIKQNLLLINHASKSTDSRAKKNKQLNTINMLDNLDDKQEKIEIELPHQRPLGGKPPKQSIKPLLKDFPSDIAFNDANAGPFRVNRVDQQREQNRIRRLQATPSKQNKKEDPQSRLPPI